MNFLRKLFSDIFHVRLFKHLLSVTFHVYHVSLVHQGFSLVFGGETGVTMEIVTVFLVPYFLESRILNLCLASYFIVMYFLYSLLCDSSYLSKYLSIISVTSLYSRLYLYFFS